MMLTPFSDACPTLLFAPHLGKFLSKGSFQVGGSQKEVSSLQTQRGGLEKL
jgi:hypothetical protein